MGSAAAFTPVVPGAGAYVGDGMPPVLAKLVLKIRRWEFIEMGELLPEFRVGPKEVEVKERRGRQARKVTDIFSWLQCYATYVAVLAPYEPSAIPELMAYMGFIIRVLSGNSAINGTLFTMNFSGRAAGTRRCELCGAPTHSERECAQSGNPEPDLGDRLRSLESAVIAFARPLGPQVSGDSGQLMRPSGEVCRK